jgi:hypothetical protein
VEEGDAVSDAGDILTALTTDVEAAVSGVTVALTATHPDDLVGADLPWCRLLVVDYAAELLEWSQEQRVWTIHGVLIVDGGTRDAVQLLLEAIRDEVFDDPTLDGSTDRASCAPIVTYSAPDDPRVYGEFSVEAGRVA